MPRAVISRSKWSLTTHKFNPEFIGDDFSWYILLIALLNKILYFYYDMLRLKEVIKKQWCENSCVFSVDFELCDLGKFTESLYN